MTIDAMGCQTKIAQAILDGGGDFVLTVKENQPTLYEDISSHFLYNDKLNHPRMADSRHRTYEKGHGRIAKRSYFVCDVPPLVRDRKRWPGLKAIGMAVSETWRNGKHSIEKRYYILSRKLTGVEFANAVRSHWSIENRLHWQLDVTFQEDQSRIRRGHADANFSVLRRMALSLLKNNHGLKVGVKNKRLAAGWDEDYLEQVLFGQ